MTRDIDEQIAELHRLGLLLIGLAATLEQVANAQNQLPRAEGLGDVVVGTQFKTDHTVDLTGLGGDHDNWNGTGGRVPPQQFTHL